MDMLLAVAVMGRTNEEQVRRGRKQKGKRTQVLLQDREHA